MQELQHAAEPIDTLTVCDELLKRGELDAIGGAAAVSQLEALLPTAAHVAAYARLVREKATLRMLIETATGIVQSAFRQDRRIVDIIDDAERMVLKISEGHARKGVVPMKELVKRATEQLEKAYNNKNAITGVGTGFRALDDLTSGFQPGELIIVAARPSMGKCLAHDAVLVTGDGSLCTIEELFRRGSAVLLTPDESWRFQKTHPSAYVDDGIKLVFRVTTRLGRRVDTTLSHPFLTRAGWRPLEEIEPGMPVAVPRRIDVFGTAEMRACEVALLAYFCSAGAPSDAQPAMTMTNAASAGDFAAALDAFGGHEPLEPFLATHELSGKRPHEKHVPASIFRAPRPLVALFLNRLFGADAAFTVPPTGDARATFATASAALARHVQHLLLRFGIVAALRRGATSDEGSGPAAWALVVSEADSLAALCAEIGAHGQAAHVAAVADHVLGAARESKDDDVTATDVLWDEVVSIEPLGDKQVYDLTIPVTHNFVADDVCVHNTAFTLNLASHVSMRLNEPIMFFSLEMGAEQLVQRLIGAEARIDISNLKKGFIQRHEWSKLAEAAGRLSEAPFFIDETPSISVAEMRNKCRRQMHETGIRMVIVDYLQLMRGPEGVDNKTQEVGEISKGLKTLARELNIPVIALSQLNRSVESRTDKRPMMSDLRESGAIEQDADVIAFLYREEYYLRDKTPEDKIGIAEIIVAKHRNGPTGSFELRFFNHITRFENLDRAHDEYAP